MMKLWHFNIQKVNVQLHCDIKRFCINTFLAIIQHLRSGEKEDIVKIFHIWLDSALVILIFGAHLEAIVII